MNEGLRPLPKDERDFRLGAVFKLPKLSELPKNFRLTPLGIKDQGDSDLCTAYATCGASELQEGVELCPEYSFALSKELSGDPDAWGQDLRTAMKAHVKFGAIAEKDHPKDLTGDQKNFRILTTWPNHLKDRAAFHAKSSFMAVEGPYDAFDNIRAAIWHSRNENRAVVIGVKFSWPLTQHYMSAPLEGGFGHALYIAGWEWFDDDDYLAVVGSNGKSAGDNGIHYFSRKVINTFVPTYGAYMFVDMTPEEYRRRTMPLLQRAFKAILEGVVPVLEAALEVLFDRKTTDVIATKTVFEPEKLVIAPEPVKKSRIEDWARAIEKFENMKKNYPTHNNPGALRNSPYQTGTKNGYATFATYEDGWKALVYQLTIACDGRSKVYSPEDTLLRFCEKYAPKSDNNNPTSYARFIALELGVTPDTKIKTLL